MFAKITALDSDQPIFSPNWGLGMFGWILLFSFWWASVSLKIYPFFLLAILGLIFVSDTAAYFIGKKYGKTALAPKISPKKTWEGVLGAILGVGLYIYLITNSFNFGFLELVQIYSYGGLIVLLGILGDLFLSLLKRQTGKKDSGSILPGHGGILDRVDSLVLSVPLAFVLVAGLGT